MDKLTLYIGNKNYSSWSLRPWIAMTAAGIPFEEVLVPFDFPAGNPRFSAKDKEVGHGDFAKNNLDKINAPEEKKARARLES